MKNYTGKTLEELLISAASDKNVTVEELTYFVTEEKKGLFGFGSFVKADVYCINDVKEFIFEYLGTFFTGVNLGIEIEIFQEKETFKIILNAENNAILIGKAGQTLASINNVVRSATNAKFKKRFTILVDINNYKETRYEKVVAIAKRVSKTVQRTKVSAALDPMPNDERKVVHQALSTYPNISTKSQGEGPKRHLTIVYTKD